MSNGVNFKDLQRRMDGAVAAFQHDLASLRTGRASANLLDPIVVRTEWQPRRAFQGWRYLKQNEAPADLGKGRKGIAEMPPKLRQELAELGLL